MGASETLTRADEPMQAGKVTLQVAGSPVCAKLSSAAGCECVCERERESPGGIGRAYGSGRALGAPSNLKIAGAAGLCKDVMGS